MFPGRSVRVTYAYVFGRFSNRATVSRGRCTSLATLCGQAGEQKNRSKSSVQAKAEHPSRILKRGFGFDKVRYRGLARTTAGCERTSLWSTSICTANSWQCSLELRLKSAKLHSRRLGSREETLLTGQISRTATDINIIGLAQRFPSVRCAISPKALQEVWPEISP